MSVVSAVRPSATEISILESSHMTATVTTESGSHYTVVARPNVGVVLIKDSDGWAGRGTQVKVDGLRGRLFLLRDGQIVAQTTPITHIYILSN